MCFGPSKEEQEAALAQREVAEEEKRAAILERARQKRDDISDALSARVSGRGLSGGSGRRSLLSLGNTSGGYAGRF